MATPTQRAVRAVWSLLRGESGLSASIAEMWEGPEVPDPVLDIRQVTSVQAPAELHEKTGKPVYPVFELYVAKVKNQMTEKFRRFSGTVQMVVEVLVSQDRLEGLTERVQFYADAVTDVIEKQRGCIEDGVYLPGTYEVNFEAVKRGGLNFAQTAKVLFELEVNRG